MRTHIGFNKESNKKYPKFKVNDQVKISKHKIYFAKGYVPNWSKEDLEIKKVKNKLSWTYVIKDLKDEGIVGKFYEKELQNKLNRVHS